jgi:CRP-like cAMP-binding protein
MKLEHRCPGTILFTEGERSNNKLYIIVEGCIVLMKRNSYELNGQQRSRRNNTLLFSVMNHVNATVEGSSDE